MEIEVLLMSMAVSKGEGRGMRGNFKRDNCWDFFWLDKNGPSVQEQIIIEKEISTPTYNS